MANCIYCEQQFADERKEAGYDYCMAHKCHLKGLDVKHREFIKEYTPALLHKSNYFWIKKSELRTLNTKATLLGVDE